MILAEISNKVRETLEAAGIENSKGEVGDIVCAFTGLDFTQRIMNAKKEVPEENARSIFEAARRRAGREPLQYILGNAPFMDMELIVRPGVLIPRPETELLAGDAIEEIKGLGAQEIFALDVCTGSGCIALAMLNCRPGDIDVTACDISETALRIAAENFVKCGNSDKYRLLKGDLFGALDNTEFSDIKFDIITSNPPYIPEDIMEELPEDVIKHEPRLALDGGEKGMVLVERLINEAPAHLKAGGLFLMEIDESQGELCLKLCEASGLWKTYEIVKDLAEKDRYLKARLA